jgi:molybdate transport system permease protein
MFPLAGYAVLSSAILAWSHGSSEFGATILYAGNLEGGTPTMPLAICLGFEQSLGIVLAPSTVPVFVARRLGTHKEDTRP